MNYLESAIVLKDLIANTNHKLIVANKDGLALKNLMVLRSNFGKQIDINMDTFSNEFVITNLAQYESEAFVITDLVSMVQQGNELTYFLYKGYHQLFKMGLVFYQLVDKETLKPIGKLEFSNIEDNIFYQVQEPEFDESSCNAIETKDNTAKNPCIAFLIGNMNEERLTYDLNRLIYETANNVQKHKNRHFTFILQISIFGGKPTKEFMYSMDSLQKDVEEYIKPNYPNSTFVFDIEK